MENIVNPTANPRVARVHALRILHGKSMKNSCALCSAVAYCCGAVAPCAIAALLGRFLPRLGPLAIASGPFFFGHVFSRKSFRRARDRKPQMPNCASGILEISRSEIAHLARIRIIMKQSERAFIPQPSGTARDRRAERWRAHPPAWRNRRRPGQIAGPSRACARPCRSPG
jgi:hypothetical protein